MTIKEYYALNVLIDHCQRDISYGEGGSFNKDETFDQKEAAMAREGIKYILRLLVKKQHQLAAKKINKVFASGIKINI